MNIKDILAKIKAEGYDKLTDAEKAFIEQFDLQAELDKASAAARRKAETDTKTAQGKVAELNAQIAELQKQLEEKGAAGAKQDTELQKLQKQVAKLEKQNADAEARIKANARLTAIRDAAKAKGINAADGISVKAFESLLDQAVGETDTSDADALNAVLDQFKQDNPAMIRAEVKGGTGVKGKPAGNAFAGVPNPWKGESFNLTKQIEIQTQNPDLAKTMMAEAGVQTGDGGGAS